MNVFLIHPLQTQAPLPVCLFPKCLSEWLRMLVRGSLRWAWKIWTSFLLFTEQNPSPGTFGFPLFGTLFLSVLLPPVPSVHFLGLTDHGSFSFEIYVGQPPRHYWNPSPASRSTDLQEVFSHSLHSYQLHHYLYLQFSTFSAFYCSHFPY